MAPDPQLGVIFSSIPFRFLSELIGYEADDPCRRELNFSFTVYGLTQRLAPLSVRGAGVRLPENGTAPLLVSSNRRLNRI